MKKTFVFISLLLVISIITVACGDASSENSDSSSEVVEDADSEDSAEKGNDADDNLGKRSNPVPIGEWIEFQDTYYESIESFDGIEGTFRIRITEIERGDTAFEQLVAENEFNEPAPEGYEWIIAHFEIEMLDGDEDIPYTVVPFISVMASTGNEVSQDDWATLDGNEFGHVDVFPGGSHSGRDTYYVPVGDDSLLVYETGLDSGIYFSITE